MTLPLEIIPYCQRTNLNYDDVRGLIIQQTNNSNMFIVLYCCLLVRVQPLSLAWADLHNTKSLWALFQGLIVKFRLGYPIFYLGLSKFSTQQLPFQAYKLSTSFGSEGPLHELSRSLRHENQRILNYLYPPSKSNQEQFVTRLLCYGSNICKPLIFPKSCKKCVRISCKPLELLIKWKAAAEPKFQLERPD